jgi:RNA polymerase-binding transcription factor DksA
MSQMNSEQQLRGALIGRELAIQNLHRDAEVLRQIRRAFRQTADFTYGACVRCETPLAPRYINATPWTTFCDKCLEFVDRQA